MNNDFKLIILVKDYILSLEDLLINIPNRDYYNKNAMRAYLDEILYLVYLINNHRDKNIKINLKYVLLSKVGMLNFYIEGYHKLKYISKKQVFYNAKTLEEITKVIYGWIRSNDK